MNGKGLFAQGTFLKISSWDTWVAQLVKCLPLAQVMILGSWDGARHRAPY